MSNYKESNVNGTSYVRAYQVLIGNQKNATPWISFSEEKVFTLDGETFTKPQSQITELLTMENIGTTFPVLNPETGEPVGVDATYAQIHAMIHSLYIKLALERDLREAPVEPPVEEPPQE